VNKTCKHQLLADKFRKYGSPSMLPWIKCDECCEPVHHETLKQTYPKLV
jgi:hypothetical protein